MAFTQMESNQQYAQSIAFGSLHSHMLNSMMAVQRPACTAAAACMIMLRSAMKMLQHAQKWHRITMKYAKVTQHACLICVHICDLNLCHAELLKPGSCRYGAVSAGY